MLQTPSSGAPQLVSEVSAGDGSLFGAYNVRYDAERYMVFIITAFSNSITAIDVRDPSAPVVAGTFLGTNRTAPNGGGIVDNQLVGMAMDYSGHRLFIAAFYLEAVVIFDMSDVANITVLGFIEDANVLDHPAGMEYDADRDLVIVTGRASNTLVVIDVSDGANAYIVGSVKDNETLAGAHSVAYDPETQLAYVGAYLVDGMTIVDTSDASNPVVLGHVRSQEYNDWPVQLVIDQANLLVYVAGAASGSVAVFNISDSSNPTLVGGLLDLRLLSIAGMAMDKENKRIIAATVIANTVATISIEDPLNPVIIGEVAYYNGSRDVAYDEQRGLAYLCSQWAAPEFAIFDMSDPAIAGSGTTPCTTTNDCPIPTQTCEYAAGNAQVDRRRRLNDKRRGLLFGFYENTCVCAW